MENKSYQENQIFQDKSSLEPLEGRWQLLYNQDRINKLKKEQFRKQQQNLNLQKELEECTFTPKKFAHFQLKTENDENNKSYNTIDNLLGRQNESMAKREIDIERIRQEKNEKDSEECFFKPIMSVNLIKRDNLKDNASLIVEDPESYKMYIKRLNDLRKSKINYINERKKKAGSGYLWNNKPKNFEDYDYTKHTFLNQDFINKNLFRKNQRKNKNKKNDNDDLLKNIQFGKAMDILHKKLNAIKI